MKKQAERIAKAAVNDALKNEVAAVVRKAVRQSAQENVYDAYEPMAYERRGDNGGLSDEKNIVASPPVERKSSVGFTVENIAMFNPNMTSRGSRPWQTTFRGRTLTQRIVDGWDSADAGSPAYMQPRPFMQRASESLDEGGASRKELDAAFEAAMKRYDIEKIK